MIARHGTLIPAMQLLDDPFTMMQLLIGIRFSSIAGARPTSQL